MKKAVCFLWVIIAAFLGGCSNSAETPDSSPGYNFDGAWYSRDTAELYQFSGGDIFCENHYFTLESGRKTTGGYTAYDNYIDVFVLGYGIYSREVAPMYLVIAEGTEALCSTEDGTGTIYFFRDQSVAERIAKEEQEEFDRWMAEQNSENEAKEQAIIDSKLNPIPVSYDDVLEGHYRRYTVSLEGIISSCSKKEYAYSGDVYTFDVWFWSDKYKEYIQDTYWSFNEDNYASEIMDTIKTLSDGDKVRITVEIYEDDSFGASSTLEIQIITQGNLSDYGIVIPEETVVPEDTTSNSERYVYITNSGNRFHAATCRTVTDSCIKVLYSDAIERGYTPCGICNPMP